MLKQHLHTALTALLGCPAPHTTHNHSPKPPIFTTIKMIESLYSNRIKTYITIFALSETGGYPTSGATQKYECALSFIHPQATLHGIPQPHPRKAALRGPKPTKPLGLELELQKHTSTVSKGKEVIVEMLMYRIRKKTKYTCERTTGQLIYAAYTNPVYSSRA